MFAFRRHLVAHRVIVTLTTGQSISGVLVAQDGPLLIIADARLHEGRREPVPMDGRAVVERSRVAYVQALPVAAP